MKRYVPCIRNRSCSGLPSDHSISPAHVIHSLLAESKRSFHDARVYLARADRYHPHIGYGRPRGVVRYSLCACRTGLDKGFDVNATGTELNIAATPNPSPDPWSAVISRLKDDGADRLSHGMDKVSQPMRQARRENAAGVHRSSTVERARTAPARAKTTRVTFVERFSAKSVSITWRDATAANYCEQLWIRRIARLNGVCALTGAAITRGDAVYSPAGRTAMRPANCAQMVLANVLEELE